MSRLGGGVMARDVFVGSEKRRRSIDRVCGVLRGLALNYGRAVGWSSCSWPEPGKLTMVVMCSAGRTNVQLIETVASRFCFTQS
jgi:hypothetical protein